MCVCACLLYKNRNRWRDNDGGEEMTSLQDNFQEVVRNIQLAHNDNETEVKVRLSSCLIGFSSTLDR